jgi:asparagine synthase (glutamine-hydrolysing)
LKGHAPAKPTEEPILRGECGPLAAWQAALARDPVVAARDQRGHFAVALREPSGRTFLAVDRFGVHSLCYRLVDGKLLFAEHADALVGGSIELDPQAIFDYLYAHTIPSPRTIYRHVHRLPPGYYALYSHGRLTVAPYWVPEFSEPEAPRFRALCEEFRSLLHKAVSRQLDGSKPACFLSGGTDSSTIAGVIAKVTGQAPATYSIGFDAAGYDEMAYARIAARHFGTEHHEYYVTPNDLVDNIAEVARSYEQPFGNSSVLPAYCCARLAKADGVQRLLAGDGGDELFGGNARYAKQRVFDWYHVVPKPVRQAMIEPLFSSHAMRHTPLLRKGASYVEQARVPMPDRLEMYNLLMRLGVDEFLTPDFLALVDSSAPLQQQREVWAASRTSHAINRTLAYDWRYTLAESDLPKVSGATSLAGVAVGFPFLDLDLVEFSLKLPARYKLNGLKLRWFFKEALRGFLPDPILRKRKHGFGLPFGVWVLGHDGLRHLATEAMNSLSRRGIVRPHAIVRLIEQRLPEHPGYYGEMLWILMMLEHWLQAHAPPTVSDSEGMCRG